MGLADGKSYRTLTRHHEGILYAFYRSLDPEQRRVRFGGAVSDDAIPSVIATRSIGDRR